AYDAEEGHWGYEGSPSDDVGREGRAEGSSTDRGSPKGDPGVHGYALMGGATAHDSPRAEMTAAPAGQPPRDPTLQHPRCVMQILRQHFGRYTPEMVSQVCGCAPEEVVRVAELL